MVDRMDELEALGREVVVKAGAVLKKHFGNGSSLKVSSKSALDYVTNVDLESEELIKSEIRKRFPHHHIMAEESFKGEMQPGTTWIVDPLDGTTNFIHGFPFVCVSIGVFVEDRIELGFIYDPIHEELFMARRGMGAYLNGGRIRVRNGVSLSDSLIATGFPFRSRDVINAYVDSFKHVLHQVSGIRRAGSAALDLSYVACGRVDGFWEVGLKSWDVAAGSLIVEEAGGCVDDFLGDGGYLQSGNIVAGTNTVFPVLMEAVREHLVPALSSRSA